MVDKEEFKKRIQKSFAISDKYVKDSTIDVYYEKLCQFDYIDICKALDILEDNGTNITYFALRECIQDIIRSRVKVEQDDVEVKPTFSLGCEEKKCNECHLVCKLIAVEVTKLMPELLDKELHDEAIKKLQKIFPKAGFGKEHQHSNLVHIDEYGKQTWIY